MTLQSLGGIGLFYPEPTLMTNLVFGVPAIGDIGTINDTAEKLAMVGRVFTKDMAAKNLQKVGFRWGSAMTLTGGGTPTTIRVSLQNVSASTYTPDGSQDQYYDMVNGTDTMTADTWVLTGNLNSSRAVSPGDLISVVFEFQAFNAGDSVTLMGQTTGGWSYKPTQAYPLLYTTYWSPVINTTSNLLLVFDDGTYGSLMWSPCYKTISSYAYANSSTPDEYANAFNLPFPCRIHGCWAIIDPTIASDFTMILTCGASTVSVAVDKDQNLGNTVYVVQSFTDDIDIAANTTFYLSMRPDGSSNNTIYYGEVDNANYWTAMTGGSGITGVTSRTDGGAWAAVDATKRLMCGVIISAFGDDAGGGSSPRFGDMTGGLK